MKETITFNHLVLYLYNETELSDSVFVQKAIDHHEEISDEFQQLVTVKNLINNCTMHASASSIETVLAYATLTAPLQKNMYS